MDLRGLDRGDRQNLATARARAKTDAVVNAQCCATEQSRQTDVENEKTPHSKRMHCVLTTSPRRSTPQRGSNVWQWSDRAQINRETLGVDSQRSHKRARRRKSESSANFAYTFASSTNARRVDTTGGAGGGGNDGQGMRVLAVAWAAAFAAFASEISVL